MLKDKTQTQMMKSKRTKMNKKSKCKSRDTNHLKLKAAQAFKVPPLTEKPSPQSIKYNLAPLKLKMPNPKMKNDEHPKLTLISILKRVVCYYK